MSTWVTVCDEQCWWDMMAWKGWKSSRLRVHIPELIAEYLVRASFTGLGMTTVWERVRQDLSQASWPQWQPLSTTALWVLLYPFTEVTTGIPVLRQWKKKGRNETPQKYGKLCELVKWGTEIKLLEPKVEHKSCPASLSCELHQCELTGLQGEASPSPLGETGSESLQKVECIVGLQSYFLFIEEYFENCLFLYVKSRNLDGKSLGYLTVSSLLFFLSLTCTPPLLAFICPMHTAVCSWYQLFQWLKTRTNLVIKKIAYFSEPLLWLEEEKEG